MKIFFALSFLACVPAGATVLYSTFLPGNQYSTSSSYSIFGPTAAFDAAEAMPFTLSSTSNVTDLDIALVDGSGGNNTNSYYLELVTDNNNSPGATVIETWSFSAPSINSSSISDLPAFGLVLAGGTQYWLEAFGLSNAEGQWWVSSTDPQYYGITRAYSNNQGSTWTVYPGYPMAFDLQGTVAGSVPEPSTFALCLLPFAGVAFLARRRVF